MSTRLNEVLTYITDNILHSKLWDDADTTVQTKAVNNAEAILLKFLPKIYTDSVSIPIDELTQQVLWMLKVDDTFQRAELGATYIQVDGIAMNIAEKDRTIAPYILTIHDISVASNGKRRKVGYYTLEPKHTFRYGRR